MPNLLVNLGMKAEGNHFNNIIFVIKRKFRYIFFKSSPISMQKLIKS